MGSKNLEIKLATTIAAAGNGEEEIRMVVEKEGRCEGSGLLAKVAQGRLLRPDHAGDGFANDE